MPFTAAKPATLPPQYPLPDVTLPAVSPTDFAALPTLLHSVVQALNEVKLKAQGHFQHVLEQFILSRHREFGSSSEQLSAQGRLFDETEALADATTEA